MSQNQDQASAAALGEFSGEQQFSIRPPRLGDDCDSIVGGANDFSMSSYFKETRS
jgi:hypothetical protein